MAGLVGNAATVTKRPRWLSERRSRGHNAKRKNGPPRTRPEDRIRKAAAQWTVDTTGMALTTGNDRRERPHRGCGDRLGGTLNGGEAQDLRIVRSAGDRNNHLSKRERLLMKP